LNKLLLQDANLLAGDYRRVARILAGLLCRPAQKISLSSHFYKLLTNEPSGQASGDKRNGGYDQSPFAKIDGLLFKRTKLVILYGDYKNWLVFLGLFCIAGILIRAGADILLGGGWDGKLASLYWQFSGRRLTDRERVFLAVGCTIAAVRLGVQAVIIVSQ
jgi:hypothetical protein